MDERLQGKNININEQIQDRTIRHAVHLERYKKGETNRVRRALNRDIIPSIQDKIEARIRRIKARGTDLGKATTKRLKELEKELRKLSVELADKSKDLVAIDLTDLTRDEIDWQISVIKEELGFDVDFVVPNARSVARVSKETAFTGAKFDDWFKTISRTMQRNISTEINRGIVEGETTEQIMRRIRGTKVLNYSDGVWNKTRNHVETVTRTTINHVSNQARLELFKENDDIVKGVQWVATLDSRTSVICAGLDGQVFELDKGARPPAHPNCRSVMTAVLHDHKKLGLKNLPDGKRASINGQVSASTTYEQWLRRQPLSVQQEVLGVTKARLFNQGNLPITKFTNGNLKPLTIKQLRTAEKKAFQKADI